jgi:hypothetical protein
MTRGYILLLILAALLVILWCSRKQRENFEIFGAAKIGYTPYMKCLNECEKIPGWKKLSSDSLLCATRCNNYVSQAVNPGPHRIGSCLSATSPIGCKNQLNSYCKDECDFNKRYFGASDAETKSCIKLCSTNMAPNCAWGEWAWH